MGRFLITGLPRSRTAWFAVATGAVHEPISYMGWDQYAPLWDDHRGVSDSGAAIWLPRIMMAHQPRTLIIERPYEDVIRSLERYVGNAAQMSWARVAVALEASLKVLTYDHPDIMRVRYDQLNDIDVLRECFTWLRVNPPQNLDQMMHMRINSDLGWNLAKLSEKAA